MARLQDFLGALGGEKRAAFEFRHPSWFEDDVFEALRAHGCALCVSEAGTEHDAPMVSTASWGYLRLRREDYAESDLDAWAKRVREQPWQSAYVFFKHEDAGAGPKLARRFLELSEGA